MKIKITTKRGVRVALILLMMVFVFSGAVAFAQPDGGGSGATPDGGGSGATPDGSGSGRPASTKLTNPIKVKSIQELLLTMVDLGIFLGSIVAVFMFLWIGFKFVMARGNEGELADAKNWFLYAVIGTALLISSKVVVEVLKNTLVASGVVEERLFDLPR